jgi:hypothetical protein
MKLTEDFEKIASREPLREEKLSEGLEMDVIHILSQKGVSAAMDLLKKRGVPTKHAKSLIEKATQYLMSS